MLCRVGVSMQTRLAPDIPDIPFHNSPPDVRVELILTLLTYKWGIIISPAPCVWLDHQDLALGRGLFLPLSGQHPAPQTPSPLPIEPLDSTPFPEPEIEPRSPGSQAAGPHYVDTGVQRFLVSFGHSLQECLESRRGASGWVFSQGPRLWDRAARTGPSDCIRVCLKACLLLTTELNFPKPSISLSPTGEVALGGAVTVRCRDQHQNVSFLLYKDGNLTALWVTHPAECQAEFPIHNLSRRDAGSYSCYYHRQWDEFILSHPSDPVELVVTGEGPSSVPPVTECGGVRPCTPLPRIHWESQPASRTEGLLEMPGTQSKQSLSVQPGPLSRALPGGRELRPQLGAPCISPHSSKRRQGGQTLPN
ncbi:leukocyte immunoglobulin-like receptor subfamily A member 3 [Macrochelys suwanniensis]